MTRTILIIEDNTDIRENIGEILGLAGYKVSTAENGKEGVEIALREIPHLIICDIMMPELDGYGVLHLLRKNTSTQNIPFIFLTAKTERSDLRKGMELGADDYITKPFEDSEVLSAVEVRLKKKDMLEQQYEPTTQGVTRFLHDVKQHNLVEKLSEKYAVEQYARKQSLYAEGRHPRYLFYLLSGKVKAFKSHEDGKEYITSLYSEGDFIGYTALLEEGAYRDSATVLEPAEIMQIPKDDFLQMLYSDMAVASKFIHIITHNVKENEDRLVNLAYSSLRKRVARALVYMVGKFNLDQQGKALEISREELAQYVGTATESLIRTLSDFKAEGHIEICNGKIVVKDIKRLENLLY